MDLFPFNITLGYFHVTAEPVSTWVHEILDLFPKFLNKSLKALILNFGDSFSYDLIEITNFLRFNKINSEFYPDPIPIRKQLN